MRTCAGALLVRGRNILLAKRADDRPFYPGLWDIIGGHCEPNETPADTLTRELLQEIGITPRIFEEIGGAARAATFRARRRVLLRLRRDGFGMVSRACWARSIANCGWMSLADALALPLAHPAYRELFAKVLALP